MKPEHLKHLKDSEALSEWVKEYYHKAANEGDFSIIDKIIGDFSACNNNLWKIEGKQGVIASIKRTRAAISEIHFDVYRTFVKMNVEIEPNVRGDLVSLWWKVTGRFTGELVGIKPSMDKIEYNGSSLLYFQNFKMIGAQAVSDIYQQMGTLPPK